MTKLSAADIASYQEHGYLSPIRVLSDDEARGYRTKLEAIEASGAGNEGYLRSKPHLLYTFLYDLVRHPKVLDAVEACLGRIFFAGRPISSPRSRRPRILSAGIKTLPIGDWIQPIS